MKIILFTDKIIKEIDHRFTKDKVFSDPLEKERVKHQLRTIITMLGNNLGDHITKANAPSLKKSVITQIQASEINSISKTDLITNVELGFQVLMPLLEETG